MAYIQITTRCNMKCAHCCFAATTKGETMDRETYMAALQFVADRGDYLTIGGGEPTVHKDFIAFLEKAIEMHGYSHHGAFADAPLVITNGKIKTKAHKLLDMIDNEVPLHVELSLDDWHDPIDPSVVQRFKAHQRRTDSLRHRSWGGGSYDSTAGIRTVPSIVPVGRAIEFSAALPMNQHGVVCCCEDYLIDPVGDIWSCGCKHTKLGNVWDRSCLDNYSSEYAHTGGVAPEDADECCHA